MKKQKYNCTNKYILRSPLLPLNFFYKFTEKRGNIDDTEFVELFNSEVVREAIYLASPALYDQFEKFVNGKIINTDKRERLRNSVLKYISRMSSRCTPYGLFAGCSVGEFDEHTDVTLNDVSKYKRHTRLDMNFVVFLSYEIIKNPDIRNKLRFYPNSSLYKIKDKFRYIEYYYRNNHRHYDIVAVDSSEYLEKIIHHSSSGLFIDDIVNLITDEDITKDIASEFVEELIETQVLVSELEPSVSGLEFTNQIISILKERIGENQYNDFLHFISNQLNTIDLNIGNDVSRYTEINKFIENKDINFDLKYLFQCDLTLTNKSNTINKKILNQIINAVYFLNKIKKNRQKNNLDSFREAFLERYEGHEMPLLKVLDPEIGIGYGRNMQANDDNPLIDDLYIPQHQSFQVEKELKWSPIDDKIQEKIILAIKNNEHIVTLEDKDFDFLPNVPINELPQTISFLIEVVKENANYKVKLNGGGGGSGANLLARFCHGDIALEKYVQDIINIETASTDKIIAEIVHLPEARVGNILARPDFREYEIPYLARSVKRTENQILLDDLMVSIWGNNIILRSKKHQKEVLPRLTNAHNFSNNNALPIYHFLCDIQSQTSKGYAGVYFDMSQFDHLYTFIPRIEYKNIILSYATWNIDTLELKPLITAKTDELILKEIKRLKKILQLPSLLLIAEGDNELLVNTENLSSIKMLIETIKNRPFIKLNEFIFNEKNLIVKDSKGNGYTNEIILTLFKSELN